MPKKVKVEKSRLFPGPFLCLVFLAECTRLTAAKKWREILAIVALIHKCLYSYFDKEWRKKKCTRQSRKVIWDMINTLFLTTVAVEPTFVAFL